MGRFARSWQMFKASWRVLRSRKELAAFRCCPAWPGSWW